MVSPAAKWALGRDEYHLAILPFRVGRETREFQDLPGLGKEFQDRRKGIKKNYNDLYIYEPGKEKFISQEHFLIDELPQSIFVLIDRESSLGTVVDDKLIGGERRGGGVHLSHGTTIIPGGEKSPFVFRFELREAIEDSRG